MNSYERVMNTLQGIPADRVPVFAVLGAYGGRVTGTDLQTIYTDTIAYVAGQNAVRNLFGLDMVTTPFDYSAIVEAFGGKVAYFRDQAPNMKKPAVSTALEAMSIPLPDPHSSARLPLIIESSRQLSEIYYQEVPVFAVVPGPGALPVLILGMEAWMETLLFDYNTALKLLEYSSRFFVSWTNAFLEAGVTGIVVTESMGAAEITTREIFKNKLMPHIHNTFSLINGPIVFHHGGGCISQILDLLPGLPNLAGVVIGSKDSLSEARSKIGSDFLLLGNIDNLSYPSMSVEEMKKQCLDRLETAAPPGRFILCNSGADIPVSTPPGNIQAMLDASKDYSGKTRG